MINVKSCPFCGWAPKIECILKNTSFEAYFIKCTNENCECEIKCPRRTEQEAVDAWNIRVDVEIKEIENDNSEHPTVKETNATMEMLIKFKDEISEKFGEQSIWLALLLLQLINKDTWKFDKEIIQINLLPDIMKFIEENEPIKELFMNKEDR